MLKTKISAGWDFVKKKQNPPGLKRLTPTGTGKGEPVLESVVAHRRSLLPGAVGDANEVHLIVVQGIHRLLQLLTMSGHKA